MSAPTPSTAPTPPPTAPTPLALAEAPYRSLLEAALDEIVVFSRDGRLEYLNAAAAGRLGRAAD